MTFPASLFYVIFPNGSGWSWNIPLQRDTNLMVRMMSMLAKITYYVLSREEALKTFSATA